VTTPAPSFPPIKFDFHLHTLDDPFDKHIYHTVFELLDKAATLGYGALAITLHNQQFASSAAADYARERGILLIPGVERSVGQAHVLMINFPAEISDGVKTFEGLRSARDEYPAGLIIAAHPYYPSSVALQKNFLRHKELFHAVEVSGFYHKRWNPNRKAVHAATTLHLPLIGNSDTHTLEQFGTTWTEARCPQDAESIVNAVKTGRTEIKSRPLGLGELGLIGWKVVAMGYMKWIDYKRSRGWKPPLP
jgi:predicted metal-dependent phosphoesterase TrpH